MNKKIIGITLAVVLSLLACNQTFAWTEGNFVGSDGYWYTSRGSGSFSSSWEYMAMLYDSVGSFAYIRFGHSGSSDFTKSMTLVSGDSSYAGVKEGNASSVYGSRQNSNLWSTISVSHSATPVYFSIDWIKSHTQDLYAYVDYPSAFGY